MTAPAFDHDPETPLFLLRTARIRNSYSRAFRAPVPATVPAPLERQTEIPDDFGIWMAQARPELRWDARHFRVMARTLDDVTSGKVKRVFFQLPIRHGKSEMNTVGFAAYLIERDPRVRIIVASYNQKKADKFSRKIRKLVRSRGVAISDERDAAGEWETAAGGEFRAAGAGSGVAGENADFILIDDPIGKRADAESPTHREFVWDWITNDLLARCEPHTAVIATMSRWHTDDPAGRIRDGRAGVWKIIDLPGRAEKNDPLGREENEPLWPEFRGEEWLDEKRIELGEYGFASLIQGRPRPREGGMFKWSWWQLVDEVPSAGSMVRYWDLAGTEPKGRGKRHDPDFSAGALLCRMNDKRTAICDVERFRKSIAQRDAELERICKQDLANYRGRIKWWIETEAGIAGEDRTADLVRRLQALGMPVYTEHPTGNKTLRAEPLAAAAEVGNLILVKGKWNDEFRSEAADFPNGTHDDQIDAADGAYSKISNATGAWGTSTWSM